MDQYIVLTSSCFIIYNGLMVQFLFVFGDWGLLVLRVALGLILISHGFPKLRHFGGTVKMMREMRFWPPAFWAAVAGLTEFMGGLFLAAGFLTQTAAALVALQFLVILVKLKFWERKVFSEWEYDLLILAAALLLVTAGSGRFGLDDFWGVIIY